MVAAAVAGNALEFYDFGLYAFFAVHVSKAFFPASMPPAGPAADAGGPRRGLRVPPAGRRRDWRLCRSTRTQAGHAVDDRADHRGTLGLALTPSSDGIGLAGPLIVVVCRLVQGL